MEPRFDKYTKFKTKNLSPCGGENDEIVYYIGPRLIKDVWFELFSYSDGKDDKANSNKDKGMIFFYPSEVDKFEQIDINITNNIDNIDNIKTWPIIVYQTKCENLFDEYNKNLAALEAELKTAQKICDHSETRYWPDPSGNNDSFTECCLCGREL